MNSGDGLFDVILGLPMPPLVAVQTAVKCLHPFDSQLISKMDAVKVAVFNQLVWGPEEMHKYRVGVIRKMKARKKELEPLEQQFRDSMHPDVCRIMSSKNLSLFDEMLKEINDKDVSLVRDLRGGLSITGNAEVTGKFAVEFKPAQLEVQDLWSVAKSSQAEVLEKIPHHMKGGEVVVRGEKIDVAARVWESTISEAQRGWLEGPLSAEQVSKKLGALWTPSRRFGIVQGGKVRNIDDLSEFGVNQAYGTPEKLDLGGLDEVMALAAEWIRAGQQGQEEVSVALSSGKILTGKLHADYKSHSKSLRGRCLDLKSAYKQIALRPTDQANAVLAVLDPDSGSVRFFISNVLPFGATGAVMGFNRVARALRDLMQQVLFLPTVNYFDDYPHVDIEPMAVKSQVVMEEFLQVLGWDVSKEPKKRLPPAQSFTVLGAVVDLSETAEGVVSVKNKPERLQELVETQAEVARMGETSPALASRIQGRLNYAEAQCAGRWIAPVLEPIKRRALLPASVKWLSTEISEALELCIQMMTIAPCCQ